MGKSAEDSWLETFPPVADGEPSPEVPHAGKLSKKQIAALEERGYKPVDIRFIKDSEKLINLAVQGTLMGTIELTTNMIRGLDLLAKVDNLLDRNRARREESPYSQLVDEILKTDVQPDATLKSQDKTPLVRKKDARGDIANVGPPPDDSLYDEITDVIKGVIDGISV